MQQKTGAMSLISEDCKKALSAVRDALDVMGGKWKLPIIITLFGGPLRFKEMQKALEDITPKILSKELKDLELNEFVTRTVYATSPVTVEYALTDHGRTLECVLTELREWGFMHRKQVRECSKARREHAENRKAVKK